MNRWIKIQKSAASAFQTNNKKMSNFSFLKRKMFIFTLTAVFIYFFFNVFKVNFLDQPNLILFRSPAIQEQIISAARNMEFLINSTNQRPLWRDIFWEIIHVLFLTLFEIFLLAGEFDNPPKESSATTTALSLIPLLTMLWLQLVN